MKKIIIPAFMLFGTMAFAQVGVGTPLPDASSQLDVVASNKGVLLPRVALTSTTDATTITNGNINSLLVFNTATASDITPGYYYWHNNKWNSMKGFAAGNGVPIGSGTIGDVYIDAITGAIYTYNGTSWVTTSILSGNGDPNTNGTIGVAGNVYVDQSTGIIYAYNGTTWVSSEIITTLVQGLAADAGTYTYTNEAGTTTTFNVNQTGNGNPNTNGVLGSAGDIYVDEANGNLYTFDGTTWVLSSVMSGNGNPNGNGTIGVAGNLYVDETTGNIYTFNGTTWVLSNEFVTTLVQGSGTNAGTYTYTNEAGVTTSFNVNQTGTGNPNTNGTTGSTGDIYVDESTGDIYTFNGTTWVVQNGTTTEPWFNQTTNLAATSNTQNIYQTGNVAVNKNTGFIPGAALDVNGAIRGGNPNSTAGVGTNSIAVGSNVRATGQNAVAFGENSIASALNSTAFGYNSTASGQYSVAFGATSNASGNFAIAGIQGNASGLSSIALGAQTNASGDSSVAIGSSVTASGNASFAAGNNNIAAGHGSVTFGFENRARSLGEVSTGIASTDYTSLNNNTDRLLNIGNGSSSASRSDAFTVLKNAEVGINYDNFEANTSDAKLQVNGKVLIADLPAGSATNDLVVADANGVLNKINPATLLSGATTNIVDSNANTFTSTVNGVSDTAPIINSNLLSIAGSTITSTVNGQASNSLNLGPAVQAATTNTLTGTKATGFVSTVNGVTATQTVPAGTVADFVGFDSTGAIVNQPLNTVLSGATTNIVDSNANTLTSTVNGVSDTAPIINTNVLSVAGSTITSTVNGQASNSLDLSTLIQASETITTLNQGASPNTGTYTYTNEAGTTTSFKVTQTGSGIPTGTGVAGDIYVDTATGDMYIFNGTTWDLSSTQSGSGAPSGGGNAGDIYVDETTGDIYTYNGTSWVNQSINGWALTGNSGTNGATNYIGTNDVQPFSVRVNTTSRMKFETNGNTHLGVGNITAIEPLHIGIDGALPVNYLLSNNTSGHTSSDGLLQSFSGVDYSVLNRENGNITLGTNSINNTRLTSTGNLGQLNNVVIGQALNNIDNAALNRLTVTGTGANATATSIDIVRDVSTGPNASITGAVIGSLKFSSKNSATALNNTNKVEGARINALNQGAAWNTGTQTVGLSFDVTNNGVLAEAARISGTGQFGIGTNLPSETIDVNGTARIRTLNAGSSSDEIVVADATGVLKKVSSSSLVSSVRTETSNYTAVLNDETIFVNASAGSRTITLPNAAAGKKFVIKKIDTSGNSVIVTPTSGTIDGVASISGSLAWQGWILQTDGTNWFIIGRI